MFAKCARTALILFVAAATLAACATPAPYREAPRPGATGYSEERIEENRYRVVFQGDSLTDVERVEDFVLFRAAELTLQRGFDHFVVSARTTTSEDRIQSFGPRRSSLWLDYAFWHPRFGWLGYRDPFFDDFTSFREVSRYRASAEITMARGPKPADNALAFDARDVERSIGPRVTRPTPR